MRIRFSKATNRRTEAYEIEVGRTRMLISYETIVAFSGPGPSGEVKRLRRHNKWGPTTGKHMNECGVRDYPEAANEEHFEAQLQLTLKNGINPMLITWEALAESRELEMA